MIVPHLRGHGSTRFPTILPSAEATARRQAGLMAGARYVEVPGGSHRILWMPAALVGEELVPFLA